MYQKVVHIHPISKLEPKAMRQKNRHEESIDVGSVFWKKLFFSDELASRSNAFAGGNFLFGDRTKIAVDLFVNMGDHVPEAKEMTFMFDTFRKVVDEFNRTYPDWKLSLSTSLSHASSDFDPNNINLTKLQSVIDQGGGVIGSILRDVVRDINNSIVVFEFFWPTDLLQLFLVSKELKERNNIIIIDATKANEQADYSQWIKIFSDNTWLSSFFDYCIVYQDYGRALNTLIGYLRSGKKDSVLLKGPQNILYFSEDGAYFKKPGEIEPEALFDAFKKYFYTPSRIYKVNGVRSLSARLFPYKCYWSSCFFCTINSTHLYKYEKSNSDYIKMCVDFIEENKIEYAYFGDEAIHADDILAFARMILERNISIVYRFRTRFHPTFTEEACELLGRSGARFCGIGLECASDRVSALVNKGNEMALKDKMKVISNFEKAGVSFHNYAIFGLPGETEEESYQTYFFLKKNIEGRINYNCTPNIFGLNRGSMYHRHPEKFGLELIEDQTKDVLLNLRLDYIKNAKALFLQRKYAKDIHAIQFLSFYNPKKTEEFGPVDFWEFIDRSALYYHAKTFSNKQPFFYAKEEILDDQQMLQSQYRFSDKLEWKDAERGGYITNLENGYSVAFPYSLEEMKIVEDWNNDRTVSENIAENPIWEKIGSEITHVIVMSMVSSGILIPAK